MSGGRAKPLIDDTVLYIYMIISPIEIQKYEEMEYTGLDEKRLVIDHAIATTVNDLIIEIERMKHHGHKSIRLVAGGILISVAATFLPFTLMAAFITIGIFSIFTGCVISLWE